MQKECRCGVAEASRAVGIAETGRMEAVRGGSIGGS